MNPARGRDHAEKAVQVVKDAHQNQVPDIFMTLLLQERDNTSKEILNLKEKMKGLQTLECSRPTEAQLMAN